MAIRFEVKPPAAVPAAKPLPVAEEKPAAPEAAPPKPAATGRAKRKPKTAVEPQDDLLKR